MHKQVETFLKERKDKRKKKFRDGLEEHIKSSTDAAHRRVEKRREELNKAVDELTHRIQVLKSWLSDVLPLV